MTPAYLIADLFAMKRIKGKDQKHLFDIRVEVNNITDVKQSDLGDVLTGPEGTTQFTQVWAPLNGFVFNIGIKKMF